MESTIYLCILDNLTGERRAIFESFHEQLGVFSYDYRTLPISTNNLANIQNKIRSCSIFIMVVGENLGDHIHPQDLKLAQTEWEMALNIQKRIYIFEKSTPIRNKNLINLKDKLCLYANSITFTDSNELAQQISKIITEHIQALETSRETLENLAIPDLLTLLGQSENKYNLDTTKEHYKRILTIDSHTPLNLTAECLLRISGIEHVQGNFANLARYATEAAPLFAYAGLPIKAINSERLSILSLQIGRNFMAHVKAASELLENRIPKIRNRTQRAIMEGHFRRDLCNSYFDLYEMAADTASKQWLAKQIRKEAQLSENLLKNNYISPTWSIENIGEFTLDDSLIFIPIQNTATLYAYEGDYDQALLEIERLKNSLSASDFLCQAQAKDREATIHFISNNPSAALTTAKSLLLLGQEKEIYYQIFRSERLMRMIKGKYHL